jgi:hypothetical protein
MPWQAKKMPVPDQLSAKHFTGRILPQVMKAKPTKRQVVHYTKTGRRK